MQDSQHWGTSVTWTVPPTPPYRAGRGAACRYVALSPSTPVCKFISFKPLYNKNPKYNLSKTRLKTIWKTTANPDFNANVSIYLTNFKNTTLRLHIDNYIEIEDYAQQWDVKGYLPFPPQRGCHSGAPHPSVWTPGQWPGPPGRSGPVCLFRTRHVGLPERLTLEPPMWE